LAQAILAKRKSVWSRWLHHFQQRAGVHSIIQNMFTVCGATVGVKNTFIDIVQPGGLSDLDEKSWSCPSRFFSSESHALSGLAELARASSVGSLTREALEAAGHLAPRKGVIETQKPADADVSSTEDLSSSGQALSGSIADSSCGVESLSDSFPETEFDWPHSPTTSGSESSPRAPMLPANTSLFEHLMISFAASPLATCPPQSVLPAKQTLSPCVQSSGFAAYPPAPVMPANTAVLPPQLTSLVAVPSQGVQSLTWFRVTSRFGLHVLAAPSCLAPWTGFSLFLNDAFASTEETQGADGGVFLRLSDGRGWVFDDTVLNPHDPSVRRGRWASTSPGILATLLGSPNTSAPPSWKPTIPTFAAMAAPEEHKRRNRRRKRGGVHRRSKNRGKATDAKEAEGHGDGDEESESDIEPMKGELVSAMHADA